jgi:predicted nucleic acid-binding protein
VWRDAALAFKDYAKRRRKDKNDTGPRRILADFLIGAHAVHHATQFLTFDAKIYQQAFPELVVITLNAA